jgi:orotate phosphoribosyltransferase
VDRNELAACIDSVARLRGHFRLRSGAISDEYFDKYRFESDPRLLACIADRLATMVPPQTDALAGLERAGACP